MFNVTNDKLTSVTGGVAAAITAVEPVINSMQGASLHQADYFKLVTALLMGVWAWATNKK